MLSDMTLLTASEVGELLGVTAATVSRMVKANGLPSQICGARRVFDRADVDRWAAARHLSPCPRDHKTNANRGKVTAISFFTGVGGLDLGMERAGIPALSVCENMREARMSISRNWPDAGLMGDITALTAATVRESAGLESDESPDVMFGGPPCQAFSTAGRQRAFDDDRGNCFLHYLDLAAELRPRYLVIENVRGLLSTPYPVSDDGEPVRGGALSIILDRLERMGYGVSFNLYDTAYFGAYTHRERVVIIAKRDGTRCRYLTPTNAEPGNEHGLPEWCTFRQAVADIEDGEHHSAPLKERTLHYLKMVKEGQCWTSLPEEVKEEAMGKSYRLGGGKTGFYRRIAWDKPCPTLVTAPTMPATLLGHPCEPRVLSIEEYRAVMGFPKDWFIAGNLAAQYRQIGNAVPVQFGEAIGRTLLADMTGTEDNSRWDGFKYSRYRHTSDRTWRRG